MLSPDNSVMLVVDIQERLLPSIHNNEALVRKTAGCITGIKLLDIPIIVLQQYTKGLGETAKPLQTALGDYQPVEKVTFSACKTVEFVDNLARHGRKNIIVAGIEAHICVQLTVLDLLAAGYNVYVMADCIGSRKEADKHYAEQRMRQAGAVITTLESILFELLVRADHPMRKEITKIVTALD